VLFIQVVKASLALMEIQHMWVCLQELFSGSAGVYICYIVAIYVLYMCYIVAIYVLYKGYIGAI
jgi:hypothetical protein